MKTATLFCLISLIALTAHAAAPINFKNIASTNVVKTNDLLLIDSDLGGGSYATRTIPIALLPASGGDTIWTTNSDGVISPLGTGQLTNTLRFTSGLPSNATNSAVIITTATNWDNGSLLTLQDQGTNRLKVDWMGGIYSGSFIQGFPDFNGVPDVTVFSVRNISNGDHEQLFYQQKVISTDPVGRASAVIDTFGSDTNAWTDWYSSMTLSVITNNVAAGDITLYCDPVNGSLIQITDHSTYRFRVDPFAYSGEVLYVNSQVPITDNLVTFANSDTNKFEVAYDGSLTTGGNTNRWILGGVTNGAPDVNVDGAHYPLAVTSSPALTGTPTINGQSIETQMTNKVDKTLTTLQSMSGPLAVPSLLIGSMSIGTRSVLTEVGGNIVCDLSLTNRYWSCSPTGNVQVLITNASAGNWGNLLLRWPATNCMFTHGSLPAGSITNWISGAPSTNAVAGTIGFLGIYPIDSTTNSTICGYSATQ